MRNPRLLLQLTAGLVAGLGLSAPAPQGLPTRVDATVARIAFGSCAKQDRPQPIWDAVLDADPGLFLMIGDNVYADTEDMAVMRAAYDALGRQAGYRRLRERVPVLATWDDHDYGADDAGAEYPMKEQAADVFLDAFDVPPDSPRRAREGVYGAHVFGPEGRRVQVLLLDTRTFRDPLVPARGDEADRQGPWTPTGDPDATILGEAQWRWLEQRLDEPADLRLLVSSIQVVSDQHGWEGWGQFPRERDRLLALIRDTQAGGVVILSGDRHFAELSELQPDGLYPLFDLTSSSLNASMPDWDGLEPNRHRLGLVPRADNFGLVTVDWQADDPVVSLQIRDVDGRIRLRHDVRLSLLRAPAPDK